MKFNHILKASLLVGFFCAISNTLAAVATTANCKILVINYGLSQYGNMVNYTDCQGRATNAVVPPDRHSFSSLAKVGTEITITMASGIGRTKLQKTPIGNGLNITCTDRKCSVNSPGLLPTDCKILNITYDSKRYTNYYASVDYTNCTGGTMTGYVDSSGSTFLAKAGTDVSIGPMYTKTVLLKKPIGNGLNVKCGGWLGTSYSCETY